MNKLWNTTSAIGKQGENAVEELLNSDNNYYVEDVRLDPVFQGMDIDFHVVKRGESWVNTSIEVKTDTKANSTGNLCLELIADMDKRKKGWFYITKSNWLVFYIPQQNITIFVKTKELKDLYKDSSLKFKHIETNFWENDFRLKSAQCVLIPVSAIKEKCKSYRVIRNFCDVDLSFLFEGE